MGWRKSKKDTEEPTPITVMKVDPEVIEALIAKLQANLQETKSIHDRMLDSTRKAQQATAELNRVLAQARRQEALRR